MTGMVVQARGSNLATARLVFSYTVGEPASTVDPYRAEGS
jgi:hypothetical protein